MPLEDIWVLPSHDSCCVLHRFALSRACWPSSCNHFIPVAQGSGIHRSWMVLDMGCWWQLAVLTVKCTYRIEKFERLYIAFIQETDDDAWRLIGLFWGWKNITMFSTLIFLISAVDHVASWYVPTRISNFLSFPVYVAYSAHILI